MNKDLTELEMKVLNMFANLDETMGHILKEQVSTAIIQRKFLGSTYIVLFDNKNKSQRFNIPYRVPVEIILDPQFTETRIIRCHGKPVSLNTSENAVGIQLHFQDGLLKELEIYSVSCKQIHLDVLNCINAVYLIYD